jgi:hypothetical protein
MLSLKSLVPKDPEHDSSNYHLLVTADKPLAIHRYQETLLCDRTHRPTMMVVELPDELVGDALLKITSIGRLCPGLTAAVTYPGLSNFLFLEGATESDTRLICGKFPELVGADASFVPMSFDEIVEQFCNQTRALCAPFGSLVRLTTPQFDDDPAQVLDFNLERPAVLVRLWPRIEQPAGIGRPPAAPFALQHMDTDQLTTELLPIPTGGRGWEEMIFYRLGDSLFSGKFQYLWVPTEGVAFFPRGFTADEVNRFPAREEPPAEEPYELESPESNVGLKPIHIWERENEPDPNLSQGCSARLRRGLFKGLWVTVTKIEDDRVTAQVMPRKVSGHIAHFQLLEEQDKLAIETPAPPAWQFPAGSLIETVSGKIGVVLSVTDAVFDVYTFGNERTQVRAADILHSLKNDNFCYGKFGWRIFVGDQVQSDSESVATVMGAYESRLILAFNSAGGKRFLSVPSVEVVLSFPPPRNPKFLLSSRPKPPTMPSQAAPWWIIDFVMVVVDGTNGEFVISERILPDVPIRRLDENGLGRPYFVHWTSLKRIRPVAGDDVFVFNGRELPVKGKVNAIDHSGTLYVLVERGDYPVPAGWENVARRFNWC